MTPGVWKDSWDVVGQSKAGGQGTVMKVRKRTDGTIGALKTPTIDRPVFNERRLRFVREVAALKLVSSAGVPKVLDDNTAEVLSTEQVPWVVMEWIEGRPLSQVISPGPLGIDRSISLINSLAEIVGRCETEGVYHRDIKPENVILRPPPISGPSLVDFGLAWVEDPSQRAFDTGAADDLSSRFLILPELIAGGHGDGQSRTVTDVTQLVGLLYACLTGVYPRILLDGQGKPPEDRPLPNGREKALHVDPRWPSLYRLFHVGFQQEVNRRLRSVSELQDRLLEMSEATGPLLTQSIADEREQLENALVSSQSSHARADVEVMKRIHDGFRSEFRLPNGIAHGGSGPNPSEKGTRVESHFFIAWSTSQDIHAAYSHITTVNEGRLRAHYQVESGDLVEYYDGPIADEQAIAKEAKRAGGECCQELMGILRGRLPSGQST